MSIPYITICSPSRTFGILPWRPLRQSYEQSSIMVDFASRHADYTIIYSNCYQYFLYIFYIPLPIED